VRRIGIDEVSYRKGHRYLVAVVDHDTGRLLWAHPGRDAKTLAKFFRKMGKRRQVRCLWNQRGEIMRIFDGTGTRNGHRD